MLPRLGRIAVVGVWLSCGSSLALAQEQGGSIQGVVKDSSGGVLPGVTIEARSPSVVGVSMAVTDSRGEYRFPALPSGVYEITATLQGFAVKHIPDTQLQLGQILKVDVTLQVASLAESVLVTAESPIIDVKQNAASASITREITDLIPKGRDFTSVVTTAPGANDETKAGGLQIDGSSGSENRFIVDGMDTTALRTGVSNKTVYTDFLAEVQVKSSGYAAEYGGSTGGVISAITKSGGDTFHGSGGTSSSKTSTPAKLLAYVADTTARISSAGPTFDVARDVTRDAVFARVPAIVSRPALPVLSYLPHPPSLASQSMRATARKPALPALPALPAPPDPT
jgi:hypothetical protein